MATGPPHPPPNPQSDTSKPQAQRKLSGARLQECLDLPDVDAVGEVPLELRPRGDDADLREAAQAAMLHRHAYIHSTNVHSYVHAYVGVCVHVYVPTYVQARRHTFAYTCMRSPPHTHVLSLGSRSHKSFERNKLEDGQAHQLGKWGRES